MVRHGIKESTLILVSTHRFRFVFSAVSLRLTLDLQLNLVVLE